MKSIGRLSITTVVGWSKVSKQLPNLIPALGWSVYETKLTEFRTIHKEDDGGIAPRAVKITMKQVFFLSTLQMLSCCQHISNFKFFSRKILTTINAHCLQAMLQLSLLYKKPLIANSVPV